MNEQQIFDIAFNGLRSQGFRQSLGTDGLCEYQGDGGLRCAVGFLIRERLREDDEYLGPADLLKMGHIPGTKYTEEMSTFLHHLQEAHDSGETPASMEENFRAFARTSGLSVPGDDAFKKFMARILTSKRVPVAA